MVVVGDVTLISGHQADHDEANGDNENGELATTYLDRGSCWHEREYAREDEEHGEHEHFCVIFCSWSEFDWKGMMIWRGEG